MPRTPDANLFENTTMSFGEHLEELRASLFKAMAGLLIGVLLGFGVATHVVQWIAVPLTDALEEYYEADTVKKMEIEYGEEDVPEEMNTFVAENPYTFEDVFVEAAELTRIQSLIEPGSELPPTIELEAEPPMPTRALIGFRLWTPVKTKITSLSAHEAFIIWLKAAFITGLILSSPYVFYQIWDFVAAGLYVHERKYVHIYLPFSLGLFLAGAAMAFFCVFKPVLRFLFSFNQTMNIDPDPRISEWIGFVLFLPVGFGIAFQLPLVMLFLNRIGILSVETYLVKWRVAILFIFVASMLLTPADPISMMLMAGPLTVLFFLGILLCKWMPRGANPFTQELK